MEEKYYRSMSEFDDEVSFNGPRYDEFDENSRKPEGVTYEDVEEYLGTVVTGVQFDGVCELGILCESGTMIVSFEKLKELVNEGYNIVNAKNYGPHRIDIMYQKYVKDKGREGRR